MARKTLMGIFSLATVFLAMKALASEIGTCKPPLQKACESAYLGCRMSVPVDDQHGICGCASIYYGICLPAAGCAGDEIMASCISELMEWDCPDMSVCGNDCTLDDGNPQLPVETTIVPLNNFGANYLRLSVCSKGIDIVKLLRFGQVSMSNCWDEDFRVCDLWVAPRTLTSVAIPADVTRLRVEQCARLAGAENDAGSEDWECLDDPQPAEYYGATVVHGHEKETNGAVSYWPSVLNVAYSTAALCEKDSHCPGSFCDSQHRPRKCAPKLEEHFVESGSHYLQARWQILQHMSKGR